MTTKMKKQIALQKFIGAIFGNDVLTAIYPDGKVLMALMERPDRTRYSRPADRLGISL